VVETSSFISQLRHKVVLKLGFDQWHFYELMDSFNRVLLLLDLLYCALIRCDFVTPVLYELFRSYHSCEILNDSFGVLLLKIYVVQLSFLILLFPVLACCLRLLLFIDYTVFYA